MSPGTFSSDSRLVLDRSGLPRYSGMNRSTETVQRHTVDREDTIIAGTEESSMTIERSAAPELTRPGILASESYAPDQDIYIFLKTFDAESQTLVGVGTYLVK